MDVELPPQQQQPPAAASAAVATPPHQQQPPAAAANAAAAPSPPPPPPPQPPQPQHPADTAAKLPKVGDKLVINKMINQVWEVRALPTPGIDPHGFKLFCDALNREQTHQLKPRKSDGTPNKSGGAEEWKLATGVARADGVAGGGVRVLRKHGKYPAEGDRIVLNRYGNVGGQGRGRGGGKGRGNGRNHRGQNQQQPQPPPQPTAPPQPLETLLNQIVGMESLKSRLREFERKIKSDIAKRAAGHLTIPSTYHMCITGNPGTGKTTVARLLQRLLQGAGVLAADAPFIEFKPTDAEGDAMGEARLKTKEYITKAKGGVLFADEAHNLTVDKQNMYGKQVAQELMNCLQSEDDAVIVIYAGKTL